MYPAKVKTILTPLILRITVGKLGSSERIGHAFEGVDKRASKIVGWICLPQSTSAVMRCMIAAVNDRILLRFVWIVQISLREYNSVPVFR
jgi:hypothetical protein